MTVTVRKAGEAVAKAVTGKTGTSGYKVALRKNNGPAAATAAHASNNPTNTQQGGTVTVLKAGQAAVTKAAAAAAVGTGAMGTTGTGGHGPKIVLRPPRAVTAEEASTIEPHRTSSTTTMMPWRGWFAQFLQDKVLSPEQYKKFRETFFFMPDDIYDLQQNPKPNQKIPISKTDPTMTAMYRTPSPGSQVPVNLPEFEEGEDPYDTGYFKRDTRRRYLSSELGNKEHELIKLSLMNQDDPAVQEDIKAVQAGPASSPGNKGRFATGPTDFDPTGLRATMSVTWEALEASLDSHMPTHLPTPVWVGHEASIIQWHKERDLPVPVGGYYQALKVPVQRRIARW